MSRSDFGDAGGLLRCLPQVGALMDGAAAQLLAQYPRELVKRALREAIDCVRVDIVEGRRGEVPPESFFVQEARAWLERFLAPRVRPVINATGVVIHTGLGRAPLAAAALEAIRETCSGYCSLEIRLEDGRRGHRDETVEELLCWITGAEAATVVNNNAGAVLLVLSELAAGRKVIVSRGQLIEIGGAFRLPEIMAQSGCVLVEVGTTNRTRLEDYERAIDEDTAAILVAHHSNYRIVGFHEEPSLEELCELADSHGLVLIHDLGSGALVDTGAFAGESEPMAQASIAAGADVVCFSADKLLGGPQAGIVIGRGDLIQAIRRNPLARALRMDKIRLAALEATLRLYLDEAVAMEQVPVLKAMAEPLEAVHERASRVLEALYSILPDGVTAKIEEQTGRAGGGSLPEYDLPSVAVKLYPGGQASADELARCLRTGTPSVFPRIADEAVVLDMRTVRDHEVGALIDAVAAAVRACVQDR